MGNTIRREPVNFSIPASPDYKFLNITNFRGLDVSSNPFELATNTASDCLNVYVDETNTLTTRPRLEKKLSLSTNGTYVKVYPLHDGYFIHTKEMLSVCKNSRILDVIFEGDWIDALPIEEKSMLLFEQGDNIYFMSCGYYFVIDTTEQNEFAQVTAKLVDGYLSNLTLTSDGKYVEQPNILSNRYKKSIVWDGVSNPYTTTDIKNATIVNNTFKQINIHEESQALWDTVRIVHYFSDNTFFCHKTTDNNKSIYYGEFSNDNKLSLTEVFHDDGVEQIFFSKHKKRFIIKYPSAGSFYVTVSSDGTYTNRLFSPTHVDDIGISNNGDFAWYVVGERSVRVCDLNKDTLEWTAVGVADDRTIISIISDETANAFSIISQKDNYLNVKHVPDVASVLTNQTSAETLAHDIKTGILHDGVLRLVLSDDTQDYVYIYRSLDSANNTPGIREWKVNSISDFNIDLNNNVLYWTTDNDIIIGSLDNMNDNYNTYLNVQDLLYFQAKNALVTSSNESSEIRKWNKNIINTIDLIKQISSEDEFYDAVVSARTKLLSSTLFTRFDNNYWFASGNTYFRSRNNDPTYFPITEYSELGDSNEDITGFNIANDTTLLAYKPSRLYLIQPFYSETTETTEYSKTESKNTVGNTAIDAPIVTTLTEIPLQINNDGVYGLSQVSNVSAVERIADLISEPINDRWLNEDDEVIKKAQTLNRLYWTYIILPYEKLTKVYLLDNRTNSWYYWELPITLLNSFAKDNRAEFVDTDGNIYYLTTTDIRNMGFDTQLVTEYYDYGKKLIPWLWQSQVLYLGTMNHAKRLVNTTFILTDTDTQDGYGLQYSFKVFRKLASSVPEKELSGDLNLVRSTTKKTNISKFGFLQLKLSNITEDSQGTEAEKAYRNNKLRLVGLGLKYVLLEGLIR